ENVGEHLTRRRSVGRQADRTREWNRLAAIRQPNFRDRDDPIECVAQRDAVCVRRHESIERCGPFRERGRVRRVGTWGGLREGRMHEKERQTGAPDQGAYPARESSHRTIEDPWFAWIVALSPCLSTLAPSTSARLFST